MTLLRLILLFFVGMTIRRLFNSMRSGRRTSARGNGAGKGREAGGEPDAAYTDLTEQGIEDADFEEIP